MSRKTAVQLPPPANAGTRPPEIEGNGAGDASAPAPSAPAPPSIIPNAAVVIIGYSIVRDGVQVGMKEARAAVRMDTVTRGGLEAALHAAVKDVVAGLERLERGDAE